MSRWLDVLILGLLFLAGLCAGLCLASALFILTSLAVEVIRP